MLQLQHETNCALIDPNYLITRDEKVDFLLAAEQEASEAIDHLDWKWWAKNPAPLDLCQLQLEFIDVIHFALSQCMIDGHNFILSRGSTNVDEVFKVFEEKVATLITSQFGNEMTQRITEDVGIDSFDTTIISMLRQMKVCCLDYQAAPLLINALIACHITGMTPEDVYTTYVKKAVLNRFRRANGYKEGTYNKLWSGLEDNVYLDTVASTIDPNDPNYVNSLYSQLTMEYAAHNQQQH
jgi:dimeric dUTPase (all-alpha-NTP-PPase superfamily)